MSTSTTSMDLSVLSWATCPWITAEATLPKCKKLVQACLQDNAKWEEACAIAEIGYSRGWLVVRWAEITLTSPSLFVAVDFAGTKEQVIHRLGSAAQPLRDHGCSWGEIAVRLGVPESRARQGFKLVAGVNDKGLRIGKGGRYVADRPDLYVDNRKKEGAVIPATQEEHPAPSSVAVTQLRNFIPKDQPVAKAVRKPAKAKAKVQA